MHRDADAAAHADPVDQGHDRLGIGRNREIERVFGGEEIVHRRHVAGIELRTQGANVAARTERAPARPGDHDGVDFGDAAPCFQRVVQHADHAAVDRVQRVGAVDQQPADPALAPGSHAHRRLIQEQGQGLCPWTPSKA